MTSLFVWLMRALLVLGVCLATLRPNVAAAESSSLFRRASVNAPRLTVRPVKDIRDDKTHRMGHISYFAVKPLPKRQIKVGDLVTVIVRQKSTYSHSGNTSLERKVDVKAELKNWIRFSDGKLVPDTLPAGTPKIEFKMDRSFEGDGKNKRTDEVVTRITCQVVDVLPNKLIVLQGGPDKIKIDEDFQLVTLTGTCRSQDINADNTILSTQLYQCKLDRESTGPVRDAMRRGWGYKIWDMIRPF